MSVSDDRFAHTAHSHRRPHTLALIVALSANALFAATSPTSAPSNLVLFPTVTVAATGYGTAPFDMPFATSVLSAASLDTRQPRTLPIALEELPGLMVQKTSSAQGAPYIRGFTGFRTLLIIDGIRLNNSVFREGPNQYWGTVDPLALSRLELVKGPASVLYGSDAVGGTVNAVSLTPTFSALPSASSTSLSSAPPATAHVSHRYASADDSHITRLAASARLSDRLAGQIGLSQKNYHDLRAGRGTGSQPRTGYSESGLDASLAYPIGPHARLTALAQDFTQDDAWRTHSTVFGSTWLGTLPGHDLQRSLDQSRRLFAVQLHADHLATPVDELHLSLSHQRQQEDQFRLRHDRRREDTGFAVATFSTFVQAQSPSPFGRWIYGGEFYRDRVDSTSIRYRADGSLNAIDIQGPVADDATYDLAGAYLENRLPRLGPVDLILGGRFNYAAADARRVRDPRSGATTRVTADWHSLLASLRGVARLDSAGRHNLFGGLSESFRAPISPTSPASTSPRAARSRPPLPASNPNSSSLPKPAGAPATITAPPASPPSTPSSVTKLSAHPLAHSSTASPKSPNATPAPATSKVSNSPAPSACYPSGRSPPPSPGCAASSITSLRPVPRPSFAPRSHA